MIKTISYFYGRRDGVGGVVVMVKVVEVWRVCDGVTTGVLVFEEDVLRLIYGCAPHSE